MYAIETGGGSYKTSSLSYSQSTYLSKGSTGEAVKQTQQILNKLGYNIGGVDGIFGKNTDAAIRNFQKANGLTPDGIIGPKTLQALKQAANTTNYTASYASSASTTPKPYAAPVNLRPVAINSGSVTPAIQNNTCIKTASASTTPTYSTNINAKPSYSGGSITPMPNKTATAAANTAYMAYHSTGSIAPVYTGGSTSPSYIRNGSTTPYITAGGSSTPVIYNKSGSTTPIYTGGSITPPYIAGGSTAPKPYYTGASTTPVINKTGSSIPYITYNSSGSMTPIFTGGSSTPRVNVMAGGIGGSTTPAAYKTYDKNGKTQTTSFFSVVKNFGEGLGEAVEDTAKGVANVATHPKEVVNGIKYAVSHPAETVNAIKNEAIKTYNEFKNGDANTKSKIAGRIVGEIGLAVVGTKGIDKGVKIVKEATVISGTAKAAEEAADVANAGKAAGVAEKAAVTAQTAEKIVEKISEGIESQSVKEAIISPSKLAQMAQGKPPYPGIDRFRDITLKEGKIIYRGEPNGTEFFTTASAVKRSEGDAEKLFNGLQVKKDKTYGYRKVMVGYKVKEDIKAAFGIVKANVNYGDGGFPQIYIPNAKELEQKGILVPVDEVLLKNYK